MLYWCIHFIDVYYYFVIILLIALNKAKEGDLPDVMPIAVGETLRRLTGKCICSILRDKFSSFFQHSQFGFACKSGQRILYTAYGNE